MDKSLTQKFVFYSILLLFIVGLSFLTNAPDYDLWARLIVGKHFFETFTVFKQDFLSYTSTHFWFDHEWGASVIFYAFFKLFGAVGLTILKSLLSFGIVFFIIQTNCLKLKDTQLCVYNIAFYVLVIMAMSDVNSATVRCHLFSFLFFAVFMYLLERVRFGDKKCLYPLPIIMLFWSNIHGGCVSGLGLLLLYSLGEFLNKKPFKDYLITLLVSFIVMFINPYGINYVLFLIKATTMPRPLISEWRSSFDKVFIFDYMKFKAYMLMVLVAPVIKIIKEKISWEKLDKTKFLVILVTLYLAITHIKMQPLFVIASACFLYKDLILEFQKYVNEKFAKIVTKIVSFFVVVISVFIFFTFDKNIQISKAKYPIFAVEFIKENNLKGNLFVNFEYGSYVAYKLYPNNLIVMDGRYEEVYYDDLILLMQKFHLAKSKNWMEIIEKYKTDIIIIEKKYPVYQKLLIDKDWQLVFEDMTFALFLPKEKIQKQYKLPKNNLDYYDKNQFDTNF